MSANTVLSANDKKIRIEPETDRAEICGYVEHGITTYLGSPKRSHSSVACLYVLTRRLAK
jgi:hypothetical protein